MKSLSGFLIPWRLKHFFIKSLLWEVFNSSCFKTDKLRDTEIGEKNMVLNIGEAAPEFELETSEGNMFRLSNLEGQWKVCLLYTSDAADE